MLNGLILPDKGTITVRGRIGALLELGAGFHPMLTGHENIYLSGAVLGLSKKEIDAKFNEIVDFAELWDFIDAPVKHYSSGMYVRLGFAVAVHANPDILSIDEALAVGDIFFRHRCRAAMEGFRADGKTIVLVTHDLNLVKGFCNRVIFFSDGNISADGDPECVTERYIMWNRQKQLESVNCSNAIRSMEDPGLKHRFGTGDGEIKSVILTDKDSKESSVFVAGEPMIIHVTFVVKDTVKKPNLGVQIRDSNGYIVYGTNSAMQNLKIAFSDSMRNASVCFGLSLRLAAGSYSLTVALDDFLDENFNIPLDKQVGVRAFDVLEGQQRFMGVVDLQGQIYQEQPCKLQD